ncbi:multiple C2 domain and transmembrane region protein 7-like isoform X2 [Cornus florida]|uniref:multiple C2 domain and transmembrane region protein 7-like isoform X2 n=1 Tax=Cornus florida TaxID=4283 RepID=UPI002897C3EE|nr:multiple C2 domain and transmembrane region protein 7-like isoform X2 [Cornus florida]
MASGLIEIGLGALFSLLLKNVLEVRENSHNFNPQLERLEATLFSLATTVRDIGKLDGELGVPREETKMFTDLLKEGVELVSKCSEINFYQIPSYSKKLEGYTTKLDKFFQIHVQALQTRDMKKIMVKLNAIDTKVEGKMKANETDATLDEKCKCSKMRKGGFVYDSKIAVANQTVDIAVKMDSDGCEVVESMRVNRKQSQATVSGYVDPNKEYWLGFLNIHIHRGEDLAIRDRKSSDPYVIVRMGEKELKTKVVKRNVNPEWNEDLILCVTDTSLLIKLAVYDKDTFKDDAMGDAEFDIRPLLEAAMMGLGNLSSGRTIITRVEKSWDNCLAEESCIMLADGNIVQDMVLKLRNVERGVVKLQLKWIDVPYFRDHLLGLLRIHIHRGVNLAIRDRRSSDPYVIVQKGKKKVKTWVVKKNVNPVWNEDLILCIADPTIPIKLKVLDKDKYKWDDKMGEAELDVRPFLEAVKMQLGNPHSGTTITRVEPSRDNCLAKQSCIMWTDGKVVQDMVLRLRNVEHGEVELQLHWIDVPG